MEDFEAGALNLFALPLPFLTARKANSARSKLLQALKDYTERDGFQDSASFIKCQYEACHDLGTSIMSNGGLGLAFSAIGPITSTAFWMVCYIFSRPDLLAEVRAEVDSCLNVDEGRSHGQSIRSCTIDTAALNRHCPTLFVCLVEILRLSSTQPTFRIVQEDTTLKDPASGVSYELKKNDVITLISAGMLDASELWGSDHEDFRPARFDDAASQHIPKKFDVTQPYWMSQAQRAAFVPWGSGVHMCAGRFFAQEAILAYTALDKRDWELFKAIVRRRTQKDTAYSDVPELADSLEWTFIEDRNSLEDASKDHVRTRHRELAAEAFRIENPRATSDTFDCPRYPYFIQVDDEALQSVLSAPESDTYGGGYVDFVDSQWEPMGEEEDEDEDEYASCAEDRETFDSIEGCTEVDVDWMKIVADMIGANWYKTASGFKYGGWYTFYKRPPKTVLY
ncbi:hypothetical protein KC347_g6174 [Hortaea werneckii]|nr:hypothetical protein KC347_g6174 [Hortaea werneckii]